MVDSAAESVRASVSVMTDVVGFVDKVMEEWVIALRRLRSTINDQTALQNRGMMLSTRKG